VSTATIGAAAAYVPPSTLSSHSFNLTIGSAAKRKIVLCVFVDNSTQTVSSVTIDGNVPDAAIGSNPDVHPDDSALKSYWYYYEVPTARGSGTVAIAYATSSTVIANAAHAWEIVGAEVGALDTTTLTNTSGSQSSVSASLTAAASAAVIAAAVSHSATTDLSISAGDLAKRNDANTGNHRTISADAGNVASGTRSVTIGSTVSSRMSVRILSFAPAATATGDSLLFTSQPANTVVGSTIAASTSTSGTAIRRRGAAASRA
jgi:hypothetical protein